MITDVIIVGAGISGLTAATYLHKQGYSVKLLEAKDHPGGRVWTDEVNGFLMDHGFQIMLTEYPECKALLDYDALDLRYFKPGALILDEKGTLRLSDPFRDPSRFLSMFFSRVGTFSDKFKINKLRRELKHLSIDEVFTREEKSTRTILEEYGFTDQFIKLFFGPFMRGIFLEDHLASSRRMFDFTYKMFSSGHAAIPAQGMRQIPQQLIDRLPAGTVQLSERVEKIEGNVVHTSSGAKHEARAVIVATAGGYLDTPEQGHGVTNLYFASNHTLINEALLILNASDNALVNNIVSLDKVSGHYAPEGASLYSVSINGINDLPDEQLSERVKAELKQWYGDAVSDWKHLKTYRIHYALPNQDAVSNDLKAEQVKTAAGHYRAGDYLMNGSLNAAMKSGRLAAEAIMKDMPVEV